jgi:D-arabinose 1-dehydrogenase-like Zn-dependent alcohol dehydrogenase
MKAMVLHQPQDAADFLQLAAEIPIQTETESFDLSQANDVLQRLKKSEIQSRSKATKFRTIPVKPQRVIN